MYAITQIPSCGPLTLLCCTQLHSGEGVFFNPNVYRPYFTSSAEQIHLGINAHIMGHVSLKHEAKHFPPGKIQADSILLTHQKCGVVPSQNLTANFLENKNNFKVTSTRGGLCD